MKAAADPGSGSPDSEGRGRTSRSLDPQASPGWSLNRGEVYPGKHIHSKGKLKEEIVSNRQTRHLCPEEAVETAVE